MAAATRKDAPNPMDTVFLEALPQRVGHLEDAVQDLQRGQAITQASVAGLVSDVRSMADAVKTIDGKLDVARTRRPDLGAMASWGLVLLTIVGLIFGGLSWRMALHEERLTSLSITEQQWHYDRGRNDEYHAYVKEEIDRLRDFHERTRKD